MSGQEAEGLDCDFLTGLPCRLFTTQECWPRKQVGAQIYPKNRVSWVRAASARRKGHFFLSDAIKSARLGPLGGVVFF